MVSLPVLTACSRRYSRRRESAKETGNKAVLNTCLRSAPPCPAPGLGFWSRSHILSCLEIAGVNRCGSPPAGDEKMQTHANLFGEHGNRWFQCSVWTAVSARTCRPTATSDWACCGKSFRFAAFSLQRSGSSVASSSVTVSRAKTQTIRREP